MLLLLSRFSRVRLCATPKTAAHEAPPSLGFSRQEHTGVGCHCLLQCRKVKSESEVAESCRLLATPWTAAHQAPPSMGFSRQEYWSGVPLPSPTPRYTPQKNIFTWAPVDVDNNFIVESLIAETLEAAQMSINNRVDKLVAMCLKALVTVR